MRILVSSQYFPPEDGGPPNRLGAFVAGLSARGHELTVICEQPCHPAGVFAPGYGRQPVMSATEDGVRIHRLWVAASRTKTIARRLAFYGSFAAGAAAAVGALARRHDVVFTSSPPLPGVLTAAAAAAVCRTPYVVDVRDIWPAAAQALGELSNPRMVALFERAERRLYRHAARVTATTRPFCTHVDRIADRQLAIHLPNGALDALMDLPWVPPPDQDPFVLGYAGNLGIAQGLRIALDAADALRKEPVRIVMVGDGPVAGDLRTEATARGLTNVEFRPAIPATEVGPFLQSCHALLVPLRNHPLFEDFIPSKLYDAMAVGRPAIVAARGEAAALVTEAGAGLTVGPEDGAELAGAVRELAQSPHRGEAMATAGRAAARDLVRSRQIERLEQVLLEAARG